MTRSRGVGRGNARGSRRALQKAKRPVEALTFAEARADFADREAALMPDFEIPRR